MSLPDVTPPAADESGMLSKTNLFLDKMSRALRKWWSAFVARVPAVANGTRNLFLVILPLLVSLLIITYAVKRAVEPVLFIEPFVIAQSLEEKGYSGRDFANMLSDQIHYITDNGTVFTPYAYTGRVSPRRKITPGIKMSLSAPTGFLIAPTAPSGSNAIESVVIPNTGLSVATIVEAVKYVFNRSPSKVTGKIVQDVSNSPESSASVQNDGDTAGETFLLTIRFEHETSTYSLSYSLGDSLTEEKFRAAAEHIYKIIDPFTLALYELSATHSETEIRALLDHAVAKHPKHAYWALFILGVMSARNGDHDSAVWWFERSIAENKGMAEGILPGWSASEDRVLLSLTYIHMTQSLMRSNQADRCIKAKAALDYSQVGSKQSKSLHLNTKAWVLHQCDGNSVNELIDQAIAADPVHAAQYYGSKGAILWETKSYTDALEALEIAVKLDLHDAVPHNIKGAILFEQGKYFAAQWQFEEAINRSTTQDLVYWLALSNLAWTNNALGVAATRNEVFCSIVQQDVAGQTPPEEFVTVAMAVLALAQTSCE